MAKFYSGQRVRILWSNGWPELKGHEGTVVRTDVVSLGPSAGEHGYIVAPDCWGGERAPRLGNEGGALFCAMPEQLEPVLPDGQEHEAAEEHIKDEHHLMEWLHSLAEEKEKVE